MTLTSQYWYQTPATGFNLTIPNWADKLAMNPAGTLATGTITMPPNPVLGQRVSISSTQAVTSLTHNANTNQSIVGALTSLNANQLGGVWEWELESQTWQPVSNATSFSGVLAGDVTGTQGATTVAKINGVTLGSTTATSGNILIGSGTQWVTNAVSGDGTLSSSGGLTVKGINGTLLSGLATGILKNTTSTGVPSIAAAGDFPTLNQNTTGQAGTVATISGLITAGTNITITGSGTSGSPYNITASSSASTAFSALTGSTNTSAAMVVGTGASLATSGSGTIAATSGSGSFTVTGGSINNAAIGGSTASTGAFTTLSNSGQHTNSNAAAASAPALILTGATFTGGTGTTTMPHVLIQPTGATGYAGYSTAGTAFGANMASGFTGNMFDCAVAGSGGIFTVTYQGTVTIGGNLTAASGSVTVGSSNSLLFSGSSRIKASSNGTIALYNNATSSFTQLQFGGTTSSFCSFVISGTTIKCRLADNSADSPFSSSTLALSGKIPTYNGVTTAGWGVPAINGSGRVTAQTGAAASVAAYTNGAADGSYLVSANVNVTASTTHSFTVTCTYTDETNTSRTLTFTFSNVGGTLSTTIANAGGAVPYEGIPMHIRCKASTAITIATTGTFTSVTYNAEGMITQIA